MKKSRKFIALLIAVLMVAGSLAACGKKDDEVPDKTPDKQTDDKKV